jgi:AcrR family transcriptional regulator
MHSNRSTKTHASIADEEALAALSPRERILITARKLFYQQGLNAVGVEGIAAAALTNKMTLYRHFKSKDDLIVAYVTQIADEGDAIWTQLHARFADTPAKLVEGWISHVEDVLNQSFGRGCALANAAVELPSEHPARAIIEAYKARKRECLVRMYTSANYREPERLADEIFLLFEGARVSLQCGSKIPAERIMTLLRELIAKAPRHHRTGKPPRN